MVSRNFSASGSGRWNKFRPMIESKPRQHVPQVVPPGIGHQIVGEATHGERLSNVQYWGSHGPGGFDNVVALKEHNITNHSAILQYFAPRAWLGAKVVAVVKLHTDRSPYWPRTVANAALMARWSVFQPGCHIPTKTVCHCGKQGQAESEEQEHGTESGQSFPHVCICNSPIQSLRQEPSSLALGFDLT